MPVNLQANQAAMPAFFTPAQYQEMMQQYLQHMMAASQMQQFPMPFAPMMPPFAQVFLKAIYSWKLAIW